MRLVRFHWCLGGLGLIVGFGCSLLAPYPGGGNPAEVLSGSGANGGMSPIQDGMPGEPLVDPAIDDTISVVSNVELIIANEGEAFTVDLSFTAQNNNVVGGGIQFDGSEEIQWTFLEQLVGTAGGNIRFGYVVEEGTCARLPNLCHRIETKQFAVADNSSGADVDGDGEADGNFVVSPPVDVPVILRCAACESPSCTELFDPTDTACAACNQPQVCVDAFNLCFAEGRPLEGTDEADDFDQFFGPDGLAWKTSGVCKGGEMLCQSALDGFMDDCIAMESDTDGMTGTG